MLPGVVCWEEFGDYYTSSCRFPASFVVVSCSGEGVELAITFTYLGYQFER